jgi:WD40 repeat protein
MNECWTEVSISHCGENQSLEQIARTKWFVWRVRSGKCVKTLSGHSGSVFSVSFSPDGTLLAATAGNGTVKWWNVGSGTETSRQMWDAIGKKDSPIEEKEILIEEEGHSY